MDPNYLNLLRSSFDEYLGNLETPLEPSDPYLPYEHPYITEAKWRFLADEMLRHNLCEVTNRFNDWRDMLRRWHAWNKVVSTKDDTSAWELQREFMGPLMHTCLMMPSTIRDVLTCVGTDTLHQVRLHTEQNYLDHLDGEPSVNEPKPRPINRRRDKEVRLANLAKPLNGSTPFIDAIDRIDNKDFRAKTKDYRNLNTHSIGPRIALGQTKIVTRQVVQAMHMKAKPDGTFCMTETIGSYTAQYSYGGISPLDLEAAREASLEQFNTSRACFKLLIDLLKSHCAKLPRYEP